MMINFIEDTEMPKIEGLLEELNELISLGEIKFSEGDAEQICINSIEGNDDYLFGTGSLYRRYHNDKEIQFRVQDVKLEQDFTELCSVFRGTLFEDLYNFLTEKYFVGRVRIIKLSPRSCLTWHRDTHMRLHYPLITNEGCKMVIDDEAAHIPANTWWKTNTCNWHTAMNAGTEDRIHIVSTLIGEK